jgi:hypothetical protein
MFTGVRRETNGPRLQLRPLPFRPLTPTLSPEYLPVRVRTQTGRGEGVVCGCAARDRAATRHGRNPGLLNVRRATGTLSL